MLDNAKRVAPPTLGLCVNMDRIDMDDDAFSRIGARCEISAKRLVLLSDLLPRTIPQGVRYRLVRASMDLSEEHHSAIVGLILHGHYASAATLLRPLLESSACGYWLLYAAPCDWIKDLDVSMQGQPSRDTPELGDMLRALKSAFPSVEGLQKAMQNKGPATWLHKFTHGGVIQLHRRGTQQPWTEDEILLHLINADLFVVLSIALGSVIFDLPNILEHTNQQRELLAAEMSKLLGGREMPKSSFSLPKPLPNDC